MKNELTLGSLFDGSGGFPLGGMLAGITPLWASEIEPFAVRVTTKRLPQMKHYGDVSALNGADLPPVDIITFGRADKNGPQGSGINEDVSFTLNATDRHAVAFSQDSYTKYSENDKCGALRAAGGMYGGGSETLVYSTSKNSYHTEAEENLANTLVASDYKDPPTVNSPEYIVRRLTPTECARLQGFPDWWCADLGTDEPTDEELTFWKDVFETHRIIVGGAVKPKSEKQILTWLKNPHSDSAEYKLWGNGVALPCVFFVLSGIAWVSSCRN